MKKVIIVVAFITLVSMLMSCGAGVMETNESQETESPETNAPVLDELDEYSRLAGISPTDQEGIYAIGFANGKTVKFDASAAQKAHAEAQTRGFEGSLGRFLTLAMLDARSKFYMGNEIGAMAFGNALAQMLENYTDYFSLSEIAEGYEVKVVETEGFVIDTGLAYPNSSTQTYRYTQKIKVAEGQILELMYNGEKVPMRYAVAYKNGATSAEDSMADASCRTTSFVVPTGVNEVVATFNAVKGEVVARVVGTAEAKPVLKNQVDEDVFSQLVGGTLLEPDITMSQELLKDGYIFLGENHVMNNKRLTLVFDISELGDGEVISLGHGEKDSGGSAVEITNTHIRAYYYMSKQEEYLHTEHGLVISGTVKVIVRAGFGMANIRIETESGVFVTGDFKWGGRKGEIFAKSVGAELKNVALTWGCSDFTQEIWLFGDSYFNMTDLSRWPTYMLKDGYTEYLLSGYPGRKSQSAVDDFKELLKFGTPKYAVWCMGMNDSDSASGVNASWQAATDEFIAICDENGIVPILATIPNTPTVRNSFKNEVVTTSGCRYIDFASAVDANAPGSPWTSGMLSSDKVHPARPGAKALWGQVKQDFPEIMK